MENQNNESNDQGLDQQNGGGLNATPSVISTDAQNELGDIKPTPPLQDRRTSGLENTKPPSSPQSVDDKSPSEMSEAHIENKKTDNIGNGNDQDNSPGSGDHFESVTKLPDDALKIIVNQTSLVVFDNLKIDPIEYKAIAALVRQEVDKLIQESTPLDRVHKVCGGAMDESYCFSEVSKQSTTAAIDIANTVCQIYELQLENNKGLHAFYKRLVRYYAGIITAKFTNKWLGKMLCQI